MSPEELLQHYENISKLNHKKRVLDILKKYPQEVQESIKNFEFEIKRLERKYKINKINGNI